MPRLRAISSAELARTLGDYGKVFQRLAGARIFLSGGTGFFGKWIVSMSVFARREAGIDLRLTVLTRNPSSILEALPDIYADPGITLHPGDIRSFEPPRGDFSHVIHAAADTLTEAAANPQVHFDSIVGGTRRMLDFAREAKVDGFLMASSGAIYGPIAGLSGASEADPTGPDPTDPRAVYAEAKRAAEMLCTLAVADGRVPATIARCFAFVGPFLSLDAHFAVGNFIRDALAGRDIVIHGDGTPLRSYLYAGDLVGWLLTVLINGNRGAAYNVGSDRFVSIRALAECVQATLAPGRRVIVETEPDPARAPHLYVPNIAKARDELGLFVRRGLEDAISATGDWAGGAG